MAAERKSLAWEGGRKNKLETLAGHWLLAASIHCRMRRPFVLVVLLFAMLWQSVALARIGSSVNALADLEHAALHLQQAAHHHHEDGSYHLDESYESTQHLLTDHLSMTIELLISSCPLFPPLGSTAPGVLHHTTAAGPILDGLLRPPRARP